MELAPWVAAPPVVLAPAHNVEDEGCSGGLSVAAAQDHFVAVWGRGPNAFELTRFYSNLTPLDVPSQTLFDDPEAAPQGGAPAIACLANSCLAAWSSAHRAYGRLITAGTLGPLLELGEVSSLFAPSIAAGPDGYLVVWARPNGSEDAPDVEYSIDSAYFSYAGVVTKQTLLETGGRHPLVAFSGSVYLLTNESENKVWGRRFNTARELLDQAPVELGGPDSSALVTDGSGFAVVYGTQRYGDSPTHSFRLVGSDLTLGDARAFPGMVDPQLVSSAGAFVIVHRLTNAPNYQGYYRTHRTAAGRWTSAKLAGTGVGALAMMPTGGAFATCSSRHLYVSATTSAGALRGELAVLAQKPGEAPVPLVVRASRQHYLAVWNAALWWDTQVHATRIAVDGTVLDQPPMTFYSGSMSKVRDAVVTDELVMVNAFSSLAGPGPNFGAHHTSIVREADAAIELDTPGPAKFVKGAKGVLAIYRVPGYGYSEQAVDQTQQLSFQRFSLAGDAIDAAPVSFCYGHGCDTFSASSVAGDYLIATADGTTTGSVVHLAKLGGTEGELTELADITGTRTRGFSSTAYLVANDSRYAFVEFGTYPDEETAFKIFPISANGQADDPISLPFPPNANAIRIVGDGVDFRAMMVLREGDLGPLKSYTARVGDGELVDPEQLFDGSLDLETYAPTGPSSFAIVDSDGGLRRFARALGEGQACDADWQCGDARCTAGHCEALGGGGSSSGGNPPTGDGGSDAAATAEPAGEEPTMSSGGVGGAASRELDEDPPATNPEKPGHVIVSSTNTSSNGCRYVHGGPAPLSAWLLVAPALFVFWTRGSRRRNATAQE